MPPPRIWVAAAVMSSPSSGSVRRPQNYAENQENLSRHQPNRTNEETTMEEATSEEGRVNEAVPGLMQPQATTTSEALASDSWMFHGDVPGPVPKDCFRWASLNPSGIPVVPGNEKEDKLFEGIRKHNIGGLSLQEMGNNWDAQPESHQWRARVAEHLDPSITRTRCGHNTHDLAGT